MDAKVISLRKQFLGKTIIFFLLIAAISGVLQVLLVKQQIMDNTATQANLVAESIQQGIEETDLASKEIENQINLKLVSISHHVSAVLNNNNYEDISNDELATVREDFKLKGITLIAHKEDQVIGVKSSDSHEIGFSFNQFGEITVKAFLDTLQDQIPRSLGEAYTDKGTFVLGISQSGSHSDTPEFFKYAYYHRPGTNYILNIYITANEVYQFTEKEGPNKWIDKVTKENPYVKEIAVLNPKVFENPELEKQIYEPQKKVAYGTYNFKSAKDADTIKAATNDHKKYSVIEKYKGKNVDRMFWPLSDTQVIYFALDYDKMSGPIYRHSIILIVSGLFSLLVLSLIIFQFFNKIYEGIQRIKNQIKFLETGDFTVKSKVENGGELTQLSESTNAMVDQLHGVLVAASEHAKQVQNSSFILKAEAGDSVEKVYNLSIETTANTRAQVDDIAFFLDTVESCLTGQTENEKAAQLLEQLDTMREYLRNRASGTTEITITLSDLLKSLYNQSHELAEISDSLLQEILKFKL